MELDRIDKLAASVLARYCASIDPEEIEEG